MDRQIHMVAAMNSPLIREIDVKSVITKSNLPVCEYSVNPYVGCTHECLILLCVLYEAFYRSCGAVGNFFRC